MQGEQMALLEASLQAVKEKMRSFQLFRSSCQNRLSSLQAKGWPREAKGDHSPSGIDGLLAQSQHLSSSLRRVEGTSVANLRRLEQHVGASLQQQQGRFLQVEQRLLGMLSQKERVLRNLVLQSESHSHAIKGIQEWIATDHSRGNSFAIVEQALKERMEMAGRATEMKMGVLLEKMNYLQSLQESVNVARRQMIEERGQGLQQVEVARKEMRRRMNQLQGRLEGESSKLAVELQRVETGLLAKIERSGTKIEELGLQMEKERKGMESALAAEVASLKQNIQFLPVSSPSSYPNANKPTSSNQQRQKPILYQQREIHTSPLSQGQSQNDFPHSRRYNDDYPPKRIQFQSLEKKPLPPKKNLFAGAEVDNSAYESQRGVREMSGGIRGLLQKSKEKQTKRQGLSRQKSSGKKGLPPVREDPFARRKKQVLRQESEGQREEVVYEIDEEGYLMDQEGNYLLNEHGEMIRLSPEEIQQYMDEGPQY